ncbi:MAG: TetR/AcrR family transcriptional regulator [Phormidesmis sp.]
MAGKKSFEPNTATAAILEVFREKGFSETSVADLEAATGLNRSSLYSTFGNKQQIFLQVLQMHQQTVETELIKELEHIDIVCALRNLFEFQLTGLSKQKLPLGCVVTNSCARIGCYESSVEESIGDILTQLEAAILDRLIRAQTAGELKASADVHKLSRFFSGISRSLPLLFRATGDIEYARDVAMVSLSALNAEILTA